MLPSKEQLTEFLESLGCNDQEVLATVRASGVKGCKSSSMQCPIARLVRGKFDPAVVGTSGTSTCVMGYIEDLVWGSRSTETPLPVAVFQRYFDEGHYPDLVETTNVA